MTDSAKKSFEEMMRDFHTKYGHLINTVPTLVSNEVKLLRKNLIMEELQELFLGMESEDLIEIADGAADLIYVIIGTCISYGIPIERCFREVHASNMTKIYSPKTHGEKYGTINPKGPGFIPADIRTIIFNPKCSTELEQTA